MVTIDFSAETHQQIQQRAESILSNSNLPEWERDLWTFVQLFLNPNINVFPIFTSGSTGKPKQINHSREQLILSAKASIAFFNLTEGDSALLALPVKYIGGRMMIVRSIIAKLKLCYIPVSANPLLATTIEDKFDFAAFTPMQFATILNDTVTQKMAANIATIIIGGGEVSNTLQLKITQLKNAVYHTYGMTETASHVAVKKLNGIDASENFSALPNVTFALDARNCLVVNAPLFNNDSFITNDVVELLSPVSFVWKGRFDNVINTGGVKVPIETIEQKLHDVIKSRFFLIAEKDETLGERVVLAIESQAFTTQQLQQLIENLESHLDKHTRPKQLLFVSRFAETESGKILRTESLKLETKRVVL